jgi:acyl-coenzyme A thioesterase PaaI-like protein
MLPRFVRWMINFWPPLFFSGIRTKVIASDWSMVEAELRLRWWNRNAVGTMFGGSLFAMTDPFYPLMLQHQLGPGYAVWTKSADIEFMAPGRSLARATFRLSREEVERIRVATEGGDHCTPSFSTEIVGPSGKTIARINSVVHVRRLKSSRFKTARS